MKSFWMKFVNINFLNEILLMKLVLINEVLKFFWVIFYVKLKGNDNRFNTWIDKKDLDWNFINEIFEMKLLNEIFWMRFYKWKYFNEIS